MPAAAILVLPQHRETPITGVRRKRMAYRYAYARAADTAAADEPGQDYLTLREDGRRLSFALCDGVGQSFFGDLAARAVGDRLRDMLWESSPGQGEAELSEALAVALADLTEPTGAAVATLALPPTAAPMLRAVLEQKRALGSESTFVCGLIDLAAGRLFLAWMGDSRVRLWRRDGEDRTCLGDTFRTAERWSSRRGLIGKLHSFGGLLSDLRRLVVYSDGLQRLDTALAQSPGAAELDAQLWAADQEPANDDQAYLEIAFHTVATIWLGAPPAPMAPPPAPVALPVAVHAGPRLAAQSLQEAALPDPSAGREAVPTAHLTPAMAADPTTDVAAQGLAATAVRRPAEPGRLGLLGGGSLVLALIIGAALLPWTLHRQTTLPPTPTPGLSIGWEPSASAGGYQLPTTPRAPTASATGTSTASSTVTSTATRTLDATATLTPIGTPTLTATATTPLAPPPPPPPPASPGLPPEPPTPAELATDVPSSEPELPSTDTLEPQTATTVPADPPTVGPTLSLPPTWTPSTPSPDPLPSAEPYPSSGVP